MARELLIARRLPTIVKGVGNILHVTGRSKMQEVIVIPILEHP